MKTHSGNIGKCVADVGEVTIDTLRRFEIPYDELIFGKPYADFYIDDLAIDARFDLERELGIYKTDISERDFNHITIKNDIVTKEGSADKIRGEIYWYSHIPNNITHLFPKMLSYSPNMNSYDIDRICGVSLSYLYVTEAMSTKMLENYLETIELIHNSVNSDVNQFSIDIYANYVAKIKKRYSEYNDYSKFKDSKNVYQSLIKYFEDYANKGCAIPAVVHGDPVFSNCIVNEYGQFKFIDMNGLQGVPTIFGDALYDYGKIYQSLIGYDAILLDKIVSIDYKSSMINTFNKFVEKKFNNKMLEQIKMITNSLLFSLIPLHKNEMEKCEKYYELISL
jgi:hypothetical protein